LEAGRWRRVEDFRDEKTILDEKWHLETKDDRRRFLEEKTKIETEEEERRNWERNGERDRDEKGRFWRGWEYRDKMNLGGREDDILEGGFWMRKDK
jgi:hypothetical protein